MQKYRLISRQGEGTFSEVFKAQSVKTGRYTAIKCMKNKFDSIEQVNNLREIQALRRLSPHPNIISLIEVLYDQPTGRLALVFELMQRNIYELIRGRRHYLNEARVKSYMYQLIKAMDHMHRNGIFHRDIKPENILIAEDVLKLADFGSCRGIYSKQPYTEYISTRWYRAPECLLTDGYYNYKMDIWGVGCVFFEIVSLFPLFPGTNELDQINKIHKILGTPAQELLEKFKRHSAHVDFNFPQTSGSGVAKLIPHVPPDAVEVMTKLIAYDPDDRVSARQALRYAYFRELRQAEKKAAAQAQALAIASSQHSTPSATPRATPAAAPSPAPSATVNADGKAVRSARAEERDAGGGTKASGGVPAATGGPAPEAAPSAAATTLQRRANVGKDKDEKKRGMGTSNLPSMPKNLVRNQAKDAESISSLPPIKANQLSQNLSKTWSNSSWKSWKSSSSKQQKWNHQSSTKAARKPGGGAGPGVGGGGGGVSKGGGVRERER